MSHAAFFPARQAFYSISEPASPVLVARRVAGPLLQLYPANATASAPAAIRIGHGGSFAARHTVSATSNVVVPADGPIPAQTALAKAA
jgi:hypothetical protein